MAETLNRLNHTLKLYTFSFKDLIIKYQSICIFHVGFLKDGNYAISVIATNIPQFQAMTHISGFKGKGFL